jgi:hypothetical protein
MALTRFRFGATPFPSQVSQTWLEIWAQTWAEVQGLSLEIVWGTFSPTEQATFDLLSLDSASTSKALDLSDLHSKARALYGDSKPTFGSETELSALYYAWTPSVGLYRRSLWEQAEAGRGVDFWEDAADVAQILWQRFGVPIAYSVQANPQGERQAVALVSAFGGQPTLADETPLLEALHFYQESVSPWAGIGQGDDEMAFLAGRAHYALASLWTYRRAQSTFPMIADDVFLLAPFAGKAGGFVPPATLYRYIIPHTSRWPEKAHAFILETLARGAEMLTHSQTCLWPFFAPTQGALWTEGGLLMHDPFASSPVDKLAPLLQAPAYNQIWPSSVAQGLVRLFQAVRSEGLSPEVALRRYPLK